LSNDLPNLGELEHEVMQLVWARGTITAEQVREELARPLKESTVRTVLRRLEDKGYVTHTVEGRTYHFVAAEARGAVAAKAVQRIVDWFCNGSLGSADRHGGQCRTRPEAAAIAVRQNRQGQGAQKMMLSFLFDSALRSCLLGLLVWALLKLARRCDTRTETAIWTVVLIAAVSMPILSRYMPALLLNVPRLPDAAPGSATALHLLAAHPTGRAAWLSRHGETCLLAVYALGLSVLLTRIVTGLLLTVRIYRRAVPIEAAWAKGLNIRVSRELKSPVSVAGAILLTADHEQWSLAKRNAVLAHEEAHLARGDFFIQLTALIHCAFFWFSPFAWWLQRKLAQIAETASDEAAILRLEDPVTYAEILIEVSRCAQKTPLIVGMAAGPFIQQRVEHILSETPTQSLGRPLRLLTVAALAVLALAVAGAKAVVSPMMVAAQAPVVPAGTSHNPSPTASGPIASGPTAPGPTSSAKRVSTPAPVVRRARPIQEAADGTRKDDVDATYNPRALLDLSYSPKSDEVSPSTVVHAGKTFYIRSNERPVAEVAPVATGAVKSGTSRGADPIH